MAPASRQRLRWENVHDIRSFLAVVVATALGAGLTPIAPGTLGTLMGVPLVWYSAAEPDSVRLSLWLGILILGTWAAKTLDQKMGTGDHQSIVIDEVVGFGISAWTAQNHAITLLVAFVLFRFFDIFKLPPVRQLDRWSKNQSPSSKSTGQASRLTPWIGGVGVMADDVAAGLQTLLLVVLLQHFGILP